MRKIVITTCLGLGLLGCGVAFAQKSPAANPGDPIYIINNTGTEIYYIVGSDIVNIVYAVKPYGTDVYHQKAANGSATTLYAGKCLQTNTEFGYTTCVQYTQPVHQCVAGTYDINTIHSITIGTNYDCTVN